MLELTHRVRVNPRLKLVIVIMNLTPGSVSCCLRAACRGHCRGKLLIDNFPSGLVDVALVSRKMHGIEGQGQI